MATPRSRHLENPNPDQDRANALKLVERAARKLATTERERNAAMAHAHGHGASYRQIAEAAGISHTSVATIIAGHTQEAP